MKYLKIYYRLLVYLTSLIVCSGDIKKKSSENEKKPSENDQSTSELFFLSFFRPPDPI